MANIKQTEGSIKVEFQTQSLQCFETKTIALNWKNLDKGKA
jgi:hypothetical protein